jgi:hypothetical protein
VRKGTIGMWFWGAGMLVCIGLGVYDGHPIVGLLVALIPLVPWSASYSQYKQGGLIADLRASGFSVDHEMGTGNKLLFDMKGKKFAYMDATEPKIYDFSAIREWKWEWMEKNGRKTDNVIKVQVNDVAKPVLNIQFSNPKVAEEWNTRLGLLLSGSQ